VKEAGVVVQDYGTDCRNCERYAKLGDVCVVEHGKKFLWEYCRDFDSKVELPDYNDLMKSVRKDQALERKKLKEKKEREKRKKQKERMEREELKRKKRRSRLRKRREKLKKKLSAKKIESGNRKKDGAPAPNLGGKKKSPLRKMDESNEITDTSFSVENSGIETEKRRKKLKTKEVGL
jgi:ATPase subunit of ABC transporter with duplicated ATPase domains